MENLKGPMQVTKLRVELDLKLGIAKDIIGSLADSCCHSAGYQPFDERLTPVQRLIEAARRAYVLPAVCAERATSVTQCLNCIIDQRLPQECERDVEVTAMNLEELDIGWGLDENGD